MSSLHDPFDLLENDEHIIPLLPQQKLNAMVDLALSQPQEVIQPASASRSHIKSSWWISGCAAIAACLLLFIGMPQESGNTGQFDPTGTPVIISENQAVTPHNDDAYSDDDSDLDDMIVLATFEAQ